MSEQPNEAKPGGSWPPACELARKHIQGECCADGTDADCPYEADDGSNIPAWDTIHAHFTALQAERDALVARLKSLEFMRPPEQIALDALRWANGRLLSTDGGFYEAHVASGEIEREITRLERLLAPMTESLTFIITYKEVSDISRLVLVDNEARECLRGRDADYRAACDAVRRFINDFHGHDCVKNVEIDEEAE